MKHYEGEGRSFEGASMYGCWLVRKRMRRLGRISNTASKSSLSVMANLLFFSAY